MADSPMSFGRRNPHCSNCGDERGGPFGHEISECRYRQGMTVGELAKTMSPDRAARYWDALIGRYFAAKGIMPADSYTPDPSLVELVRAAWHDAPCPVCGRSVRCRCLVDDRGYRARAVLVALAEVGHLAPADVASWTEVSARPDGELLTRQVWAAPWQPVPTTPTTEEASDAS